MSIHWERVKAVCFDMDGTLVDSDAAWLRATRKAFARFGLTLTDDQYAETLGLDNTAGVRTVLRHFPDFSRDAAEVVAALEEEIRAEFKHGVEPMPGAEALLNAWKNRWPLALVSTSSEALIRDAVIGLGWQEYFALCLSSESVGPSKPDPAVYREAVRLLGVGAGEALALEDSLNGVRSAQAAGLQVIGVTADPILRKSLLAYCAVVRDSLAFAALD